MFKIDCSYLLSINLLGLDFLIIVRVFDIDFFLRVIEDDDLEVWFEVLKLLFWW